MATSSSFKAKFENNFSRQTHTHTHIHKSRERQENGDMRKFIAQPKFMDAIMACTFNGRRYAFSH